MVSLQGAAAALSFLGLLLQLLALVTPHWAGVGTHEFETSVGLWTLCMGRTCTRLPPGRGEIPAPRKGPAPPARPLGPHSQPAVPFAPLSPPAAPIPPWARAPPHS